MMKRIAGWFLAFLILSACLSAAAEAGPAAGEEQAVRTYGNYQYRLLEDGTAEVLIYVGNRTELTIPADMDGAEVTSIGESAFLYCTFTDAVVRKVAAEREHLVFMLWGSYAQRKGAFVDRTRHLVLETAHPSPLSAHRGFFGCGHFLKADDYLRAHGIEPVKW